MAFSTADFVQESTTTTGTGTYSLGGANTGFQTFISGNTTGDTVRFSVTNGTDWEVCEGVITSGTPDTLTRGTVLSSSNAGSAVNWGAGSKTVSQVFTADEAASIGTVTSVGITGGTGITSSGGPITSSGSITVNLDLNELTTSTSDTDGDYFAVVDTAGAQKKLTKGNINLSGFNNNAGYLTSAVTSLATSTGLDNSASTGSVTISLDLSELTTSVTDGDGDYFIVTDTANVQRKLTKGNINLSGFNNDAGYTSNAGTVTSVSGTGTVSGLTLSGTVTSSGSLTLGGSLSIANGVQNLTSTEVGYLDGATTTQTANKLLVADSSNYLTFKDTKETVYSTSGSQTIDPSNGQIQIWSGVSSSITLTFNTTNILSGQSVLISMSGSTGASVTFSGIAAWVNNGGSAPALSTTGITTVYVFNAAGTIAAAVVGEI